MPTPFWWWKPARSSSGAVTRTCYGAAAATPRSSACSSATPTISRRSAPPDNRWCLSQRGGHDEAEQRKGQRVFQRVVDPAVPFLDAAAEQVDLIEAAEHLVEHPDLLAIDVLGRRRLDDVMADPAVHRRHEGVLHRALDVAEQDDAVGLGRVLRAVDEGLVEYEGLAVAPDARHAVDQDPAFVRIGRHQPQVIAQRTGKRIAMRP